MSSPYSPRKAKEKQIRKKKEVKRKEKRKDRKAFVWDPMSEKSILCGVNLKILISKFSSMWAEK